MNGIIIIGAGLLAAGLTFATNWLALIPWRRSKEKHWSERARLAHPAIVGANSNFLSVPVALALAASLLWPDDSFLWFFVGLFSLAACYLAVIPFNRELFPNIAMPGLCRLLGFSFFMSVVFRLVFIITAVAIPPKFDIQAVAIGGAVLLLWLLWLRGGMVQVGTRFGFYTPASQRLQFIVETVARKMGVHHREIFLLRTPAAQAYALPSTGQLLFTERLLEILTDEELAAVSAHELGHLTETKKDRFLRYVAALLMWMPWMFFNPWLHLAGIGGFFLLLGFTYAIPVLQRHLSHRLEVRADRMATANQLDEGTYARALLKIYQENLSPAVNAKNIATHPHLYDRLIAAGLTPDFPRPLPPAKISWSGQLLGIAMGLLLGMFAIRFVQSL